MSAWTSSCWRRWEWGMRSDLNEGSKGFNDNPQAVCAHELNLICQDENGWVGANAWMAPWASRPRASQFSRVDLIFAILQSFLPASYEVILLFGWIRCFSTWTPQKRENAAIKWIAMRNRYVWIRWWGEMAAPSWCFMSAHALLPVCISPVAPIPWWRSSVPWTWCRSWFILSFTGGNCTRSSRCPWSIHGANVNK